MVVILMSKMFYKKNMFPETESLGWTENATRTEILEIQTKRN